ncbi:MAG TPA: GTP-dependent dephospho-CoA kinase family protein [Candidatus Bathyarchaeia archaeon]|nr:GTP-dependent dephospho-CoA kinase family protein [Candidatus Bathyarchaeia archaeon]
MPILKQPLGQLVLGKATETMVQLANIVRQTRPAKITAVGDIVSREMLEAGIPVNLRIVDQKTMRESVSTQPRPSNHTYRARNPAGGITEEATKIIREAMKHDEALIVIDGEEDLLAIPAVLESPDHALVVYGQPLQGVVVVATTAIVKARVKALLNRMVKEND